ncbi:hypothetical protein Goari_023647, partial [Gossypium aridum]|nr:hypothetical protein [Gossypium aridum]
IEEILERYVNLPEHERGRIFEGEEITTLSQAEFHEQILEETLQQVRLRKQGLQEKATSSSSALDWIRKKDPQVHILNFLESNGLLPQRDECRPVAENILPPLDGEDIINVGDQLSPTRSSLDNSNNMQRTELGQVNNVNLSPWTELYSTVSENVVVAVAGNDSLPDGQPAAGGGGRALLELYVSQFT